ncbi:MAG: demethoxyubiquinone hydroxylase family protein [Reyranellaceae bacterium]
MNASEDGTDRPAPPRRTGEGRQPGDLSPRQIVERIVRVDQAGEYGAIRIYAGQQAVLRRRLPPGNKARKAVERMAMQEQRHKREFDRLLVERRVRPTLLQPLWHVAGFALGAATALMGEKAAMACTVAVEEVIDEHYAKQAALLGDDEKPLRETIEEFRAEELEHRDEALVQGAEQAPAYPALSAGIKAASRVAIWLSTRF